MRIPYRLEHLKAIVENAANLGVREDAIIYLEIDDHLIPVVKQLVKEMEEKDK